MIRLFKTMWIAIKRVFKKPTYDEETHDILENYKPVDTLPAKSLRAIRKAMSKYGTLKGGIVYTGGQYYKIVGEKDMDILGFADMINKDIIITYYHNQQKRFSAQFEGGHIKEGKAISGVYGNGHSPTEALNQYLNKIRGKTLVFGSMDEQIFTVPINLEWRMI